MYLGLGVFTPFPRTSVERILLQGGPVPGGPGSQASNSGGCRQGEQGVYKGRAVQYGQRELCD